MKKKPLALILLLLVFITTTAFILSSNGMIGRTGSPGEGNCGNCHGGGSGTTTMSITAVPAFTANEFIPGQTYTVNIAVANAGFSFFGFDAEILTPTSTNAGTMSAPGSGVQLQNFGVKRNATQTTPMNGVGLANFTFQWTAPATGTAIIYVAGNAVNGNGNTSGDTPGLTSMILTASVTPVAPTAAFSMSANACMSVATTVTNNTTGAPTPTYTWSCNPAAIISNSTAANPSITFTATGDHTVTLMAANGSGTSSAVNTVSVSDCAVGIRENVSLFERTLKIFPNPASSELHVQYQLPEEGGVIIQLYDMQGRAIGKILNEDQSSGIHQADLDLTELPRGTYLMKIGLNGTTLATRSVRVQ